VLFRQFAATLTGEELFPHLRIIQLGSDLVTPKEIEEYQRHFSANTIWSSASARPKLAP
jgi:hypothetical protein